MKTYISLSYPYFFKRLNTNFSGYCVSITPDKRNNRHDKKHGNNKLFYTPIPPEKFLQIFLTNVSPMSHNVPAVYDVLPARIRALRSKVHGWQNVSGVSVGMERSGMT
jgi:hypothetical protein